MNLNRRCKKHFPVVDTMLYIKRKFLFFIGLLLFIALFYFKVVLGDSIIRPFGYILSGVLISYSLGYQEK